MADHTALLADRARPVAHVDAGLVPYGTAWAWQRDLVERRAADEVADTLLTLEHPRVFTLGKRADSTNILLDDQALASGGYDVYEVDRGGDVTYHGPGQLVAYPILRLGGTRGIVPYVRALEEVGIRTCRHYGYDARAVEGYTGVWVGDEKVMAIGVRVSRHGITHHGLAINVTTNLADFGGIVPCGIEDRGVCSLQSLGADDVTVAECTQVLAGAFAEVFGVTLEATTSEALGLDHAADVRTPTP